MTKSGPRPKESSSGGIRNSLLWLRSARSRTVLSAGSNWTSAFASLDLIEALLEPGLDSFDLGDGLVEEGINLSVHLEVQLEVILLEFDGFDSLVDLSNQETELLFGRGLVF